MDPKESLENFDPTEQVTLDFLGRGILQKWAASFYQYEAGILDAEQDFIHMGTGHADDPYLESVDHVLSRTTSFPGFRQW